MPKIRPRAQEPSRFAADLIYNETDFMSDFSRFRGNFDPGTANISADQIQCEAVRLYMMAKVPPSEATSGRIATIASSASHHPVFDATGIVVYLERVSDYDLACAVFFDDSIDEDDYECGLTSDAADDMMTMLASAGEESPFGRDVLEVRSAAGALDTIPIPFVKVRPPEIEWTNTLTGGDKVEVQGETSSLGLFARRDGRRGLVTVSHGIPDGARSATVDTGVGRITLDLAEVVRDESWDCAWVPIPGGVATSYNHTVQLWAEGMDRVAPGAGLPCTFFSAVTRPGRARVQAYDPYLPHYSAEFIQRVYTERATVAPAPAGVDTFAS